MADASFIQPNFQGGEWSKRGQGRMDDQRYRSALNVCRNTLPVEEGSAARRPGTRMMAATRKGTKGVHRAFDFTASAPYTMELTAGHLRFLTGGALIYDSTTSNVVTNVSTANPAVIETAAAHGFSTGDELLAFPDPADPVNAGLAPLLGRELEVTVVDTTHFSIKDAVTGATIDGSTVTLGTSLLTVQKIIDFSTVYTANQLDTIVKVQAGTGLLLLHPSVKPYSLTNTVAPGTNFATFTFTSAAFTDGPYFDPPTDGTTITPSGTSGSVTLTLAGGATRFAATDVGRMVRLFSEPAAYNAGTTYAAGDQVKFNNAYYVSLKAANLAHRPDVDFTNWGVDTTAAVWNWATITAFTDTTHVTATLSPVTNLVDGTAGANLPRTTACATWRLGLYSDTTGYPTCGVYHEGRFWLAGAQPNRFDATVSNSLFSFAPTAADGTLADNNAIAGTLLGEDINLILWMAADKGGIYAGTQAGEFQIQASSNNDTLTPTSIQGHKVTRYGSAAIQPVRTGITLTFVQRFRKKVYEYITTDFRGVTGLHLSEKAKHLSGKNVAELAYVRELAPVIWARTDDGALIGCTYRRTSPFASEPPDFAGWHRHDLGNGYKVTSIAAGPSLGGQTDSLTFVAQDAAGTGRYYSYLMTDLFEENNVITEAFFVDNGVSPQMAQLITTTNPHVIRFYSLHRLAGQNVDVFFGGVDLGTLTVAADGHLDVPIDNGGLLTSALLNGLTSTTNFNSLGVSIQMQSPGTVTIPASTGMLEFDTSLGGDGNGVPIPDWDAASGYGKPVLFTSSAASGACALWDLTATNTPPTRLAFHATNAVQGFSVGAVDTRGNFYLGSLSGFGFSLTKLTPDLQTKTQTAFASPAVAQPNMWMVVTVGGKDYLVSSGGAEVDLLDISGTTPTYVGNLTSAVTEAVAGYMGRIKVSGSKAALLWLVGQSAASGGAFTHPGQSLGLYKVIVQPNNLTPIAVKRVLSITPSMLGFTHFTSNVDILGDEADGNPIIWAQSSVLAAWLVGTTYNQFDCVSSGGHDFESKVGANLGNLPTVGGDANWRDLGVHDSVGGARASKINVASGAVMWTITMTGGMNGYRNMSRVRYGKFRLLDPSAHSSSNHWLWDIDTLASPGALAATTDIWNVAPSFASQFYNDKTGQWIAGLGYGYLAGQPGSPSPVGATSTVFNTWGELGPSAGWAYPLVTPPNAAVAVQSPVAIGFSYISQGQILRPIAPAEAGSQNGPALGKTRRAHMIAALLQQTQGISFGTDFGTGSLHAAELTSPGGIPLALNVLYSDIYQGPLEDDYSFNSMLCWQISRPYPGTVCTLGSFLHTQDR